MQRVVLALHASLQLIGQREDGANLVGDHPDVAVERVHAQPHSRASEWPSELTDLIDREVRDIYPEAQVGSYVLPYSVTTSKYLRSAGIEAYGFAPFRLSLEDADFYSFTPYFASERLSRTMLAVGRVLGATRLTRRFGAIRIWYVLRKPGV